MENPLDNDTQELLQKSHSASQALVYIIDDLLSLTRSQDGSFPLLEAGFDIRSALTEALKPLEHHARRKELDFIFYAHSSFPQFVRGDFQRFQQAVVHIVSNAIRCTADGHVKLEATLVGQNDSHCLLEINVHDTGSGIAEDHLDELFQELEQIASEDPEVAKPTVVGSLSRAPTPVGKPTLGLGLATVARFTRLRNGLLKMKSKRGEGTSVSLLLPFPRSSEAFHPFQLSTPPTEDSVHTAFESVAADRSISKVSGSDYAHGFFDMPIQKTANPKLPPITPSPTQTPTEMSQQPMVIMVADDNTINL
jgi:signal transduction histidine kinase